MKGPVYLGHLAFRPSSTLGRDCVHGGSQSGSHRNSRGRPDVISDVTLGRLALGVRLVYPQWSLCHFRQGRAVAESSAAQPMSSVPDRSCKVHPFRCGGCDGRGD